MAKKRKRRRRSSPAAGLILGFGIPLLLLLALYIIFAFYFHSHFLLRTEINGLSVGGMTADEAREKIKDETASYLLTIYDRDGNKYHISASDIDYTYVPGSEEEKLLKGQNSWKWPKSLFSGTALTLKTTVSYDSGLLSDAVLALPCFLPENITEPTDAHIEKTDDGYTLVAETPGTHLLADQVLKDVTNAVSSGETELTLTDADYLAPAVTSDDPALTACMDNINTWLSTTITYNIGDQDEVLDRSTTAGWIDVGSDYSVSLNQAKLTSYVQSLASKYNTYGRKRNFITSKGDTVLVGGGDYGWVIDKKKEAEQITADLATGSAISREPVYEQRAISRAADDIGNTYVEIDYTNQHLWYYKEGTLVTESDIVSGKLSNGNGSPDGIFKIVYRQSPAVLKGEDYESNVTYFMPFAYNVGIHDADWRSAFGGNIYVNSGSHGCVNVPFDCAEAIYQNIEVGTPVVAYYREPVSLTSKSAKISNAYSYEDPDAEKTADTATP